MSDDRRIEDAPPAWGASVRISASIEPEAAAVLETLARRLYPKQRAGQARALILEIGIRALYRQVLGDAAAEA
ncbi:MAG TPA: hypothetical protein VF510_22025 [Ktedonobacterales bacterium]